MYIYGKVFPIITSISISTLVLPAYSAEQETSNVTKLIPIEVSGQAQTKDEKGQDDVYDKNVSNVYIGKEYLERYKVDAAGDILKGLNGVYNMNTHTAGSSITPNIRGITGKGRIPVTVDGVEQTVDVWMNNYGVGDRNYLDPALFRSIAVDKSPDITADRKTGVGGSVAIRTIEADDIIEEGKTWGFQFKGNLSNNSVSPQQNLKKYLNWPDYRTLPGGATADGAGGGADPNTGVLSPLALRIDDIKSARQHENANNFKFGNDKAAMLVAAFKNDITEGLVAYSERTKGNYFPGKHGADGYLHNPVYDYDSMCTGQFTTIFLRSVYLHLALSPIWLRCSTLVRKFLTVIPRLKPCS